MKDDYVIVGYRETKNGIDINRATICFGDKEFKIEHPTKNGYVSKQPILSNFEYEVSDEEGQPVLIISEQTAQNLMKEFKKRDYKVWHNPSKPILREHVLINYMHDPYDRG